MNKSELRRSIKAKLNLLDSENYQGKSKSLSVLLLELISEINSKHCFQNLKLGVFSPFQKEPLWFSEFGENDFYYLVVHMWEDSHLSFHPMDLKTLKLGLIGLELDEKLLKQEEKPDVILIPGLAFTQEGERLGRGKGYFDRYLASYQGIKVGLCFDLQIEKDVFGEPHDIAMDYIVTETKIYRRG